MEAPPNAGFPQSLQPSLYAGTITATSAAGGLVGVTGSATVVQPRITIADSFSEVNVTTTGTGAGGLIGNAFRAFSIYFFTYPQEVK